MLLPVLRGLGIDHKISNGLTELDDLNNPENADTQIGKGLTIYMYAAKAQDAEEVFRKLIELALWIDDVLTFNLSKDLLTAPKGLHTANGARADEPLTAQKQV
jgi:hypothetical protein